MEEAEKEKAKKEEIVEETPKPEPPATFQFLVQVKGKIYADPQDPNSAVTGLESLKAANVSMTVAEKVINYNLDVKGEKRLQLKADDTYHFKASHPGYLNNAVNYLPKTGNRPGRYLLRF